MESKRRSSRLLGIFIVLAGLAINSYSIGFFLADDHSIGNAHIKSALMVLQGGAVLLGFALLIGWKAPIWRPLRALLLGFLPMVIGLGGYGTGRMKTDLFTPEIERIQNRQMERLLASESVHLKLTPRFKKLGTAAENLRIPSAGVEGVFSDPVRVIDLVKKDDSHKHELASVGVQIEHYGLGRQSIVLRDELDLMRPILDRVDRFEHSKFGFVQGDFEGKNWRRWRVEGYFKGVAWLKSGERVQMKGGLQVLWELDEDADPMTKEHLNDPKRWHISEFLFLDFHTERTERTLFTEELAQRVTDPEALFEAQRNITREHIFDWLTAAARNDEWFPPDNYWDYRAAWALPAVSVVDIDGDGLDDFYKMAQYGKNQLFRNNGNGTFDEIAGQVGLDVKNHTNCALFADFDNDGDVDCFLGRSLEPSMYMVNDGGKFRDASDQFFGEGQCYFVSTASAVDYDGNGLLDIYIGTYAAQITVRQMNKHLRGQPKGKLLTGFLPEDQAGELYHLAKDSMENHIRDRVGPPNALMRNVGGGRFERAEDAGLELYRNTFQATWADYDSDGDPDVYIANDFAYNNLFRNDDGTFTDVSVETASQDVGFGMGCSWGDVDRDGDQDLYVSNMYSKAGNRIVDSISGMDPRFKDMAAGNSLLAWNGQTFDRISSKDGTGKRVEVGGWSWGSQYVDCDNDGWLDIYTLNGYYSAPELYRDDVDL
ncbi:MAG: hypothetical protein CMJ89_09810 [Planctomycetes bacterium]|jgi:hypothetical protein|nr:hypothetical protein [Planctomycetota bacterium]